MNLLPGIHVELVSGMADGADRIAAEAALAAGMNVHALLPMPLDMYLTDFDEASQAHLRSLLADPRVQTTELELPAGIDREAASVHGWARDALYVALAERLFGEGRVLIWTSTLDAFWNDLAVQPVFLPFVHQLVRYASGRTETLASFQAGRIAYGHAGWSHLVPPRRRGTPVPPTGGAGLL